jgi:DNA-binding transcriptional LysR family regulator
MSVKAIAFFGRVLQPVAVSKRAVELRLLRAFVTVAEELSFRRAAERLHVSQPPLSRQIRALEDELEVRLLRRDRRSRVSLTDAGYILLSDARRMLAAATSAVEHVKQAARGERGQLNIGGIAALSQSVLPSLMSSFHAKFPQIEVCVFEMQRKEQIAALEKGRIHAGIFPAVNEPRGRRFQSFLLFQCPVLAILPPKHELTRRFSKDIDAKALSGQRLLVPSPDHAPGYADRLKNVRAAVPFTPASIQPVDGLRNLLGLVAAGYGVAILPEAAVSPAPGNVRVLPLRAPVPKFELKLLWLRDQPSMALQNFVSTARTWCRQNR